MANRVLHCRRPNPVLISVSRSARAWLQAGPATAAARSIIVNSSRVLTIEQRLSVGISWVEVGTQRLLQAHAPDPCWDRGGITAAIFASFQRSVPHRHPTNRRPEHTITPEHELAHPIRHLPRRTRAAASRVPPRHVRQLELLRDGSNSNAAQGTAGSDVGTIAGVEWGAALQNCRHDPGPECGHCDELARLLPVFGICIAALFIFVCFAHWRDECQDRNKRADQENPTQQ
jgi:hypothetical protein